MDYTKDKRIAAAIISTEADTNFSSEKALQAILKGLFCFDFPDNETIGSYQPDRNDPVPLVNRQ